MGIFDKLFNPKDEKPDDKAMSSAQDQPIEDRELCSFVKKRVEEIRGQANRIAHEGIWMTNIAYILGFDSVFYDPSLRQFRPLGTGAGANKRNRVHSNLLLPGCQNRLARMLKNPPKYDVRPNSMEEEDKEAARLGLEIIGMVWDQQAVNKKRISLGMWLQQCGHSYFKVSWDDQLGEPLVDPETDEFRGFEGQVRIDVASAFECFADPLAKEFEDVNDFTQAKVRKLDYYRTHYPERGHLVKEEGAWLLSAQYEMRVNTLSSVGPSSSGTSEQMKNSAIELSYYEKRSKKYPNGRHVITANGVLLKNDELPCGEIPFSKFDDAVIGGKYYSEALVTHARPLQDQYNTNLKKTSDWIRRLVAGKYIAAKGHGLIQEAFNDQSGEIVEFDPVPGATEPHAVQMPTIPQFVFTERELVKKDLNEILGLSEVSRGNLPSASIPAQGIQILLEQDETRIGIETEQHEHAFARVGMLILKNTDKYCITDRKLKTKSGSSNYKIKNYNGSMLKKNFDVTVIRGSTIPNLKVIKRQEILNAYGQGLLGDPQDPSVREKVLGMLEYGDVAEAWIDFRVDMAQIQRTIDKIVLESTPPEVDQKDNHPLHMLIKNRFRKSEKAEELDDHQKLLLDNDIMAHAQCIVTLQNPALGKPPDDGPPPELLIQHLHEQAQGLGLANNMNPPQNNNTGAPQ